MRYLDIVNNILTRFRLDKVSSVDEDNYSRLIGVLVNDAKREVEDAWTWNVLRTSVVMYTEAHVFAYELSGVGNRGRLLFNEVGETSVWNVTDQTKLRGPMPSDWMTEKISYSDSLNPPIYFDINGQSNGNPAMNLYPIPDRDYQIQADVVIPQGDLVENNDKLIVPSYPVILGAFSLAIAERGEDGGLSQSEAYARYQDALSDAIQLDARTLQSELQAVVV